MLLNSCRTNTWLINPLLLGILVLSLWFFLQQIMLQWAFLNIHLSIQLFSSGKIPEVKLMGQEKCTFNDFCWNTLPDFLTRKSARVPFLCARIILGYYEMGNGVIFKCGHFASVSNLSSSTALWLRARNLMSGQAGFEHWTIYSASLNLVFSSVKRGL